MSQQIGGYPPSTAGSGTVGGPSDPPTTQVARDEATDVGRTAADAGRQVAGTAADQVGNVAQEVRTQARDLVGEARGQVRNQAVTGQQKAVDAVRTLTGELREMADSGQQSGMASELARQVAVRGDRIADWLGDREPADLLDEVRTFARRRPGAFLLGAALAGVVVGRLTRGAVDSARQDSGPAPQRLSGPAYSRAPLPPSPGPGAFDAPTPPRGEVAPRPYAPPPVAPPPGAAGPDPYDPPAGRHTLGVPGDPTDEVERAARERGGAGDGPFDDPYRPGAGPLR